ncbi:hypothetical protein U5801_14860 [Lamprobacter modestohalophilus]|uniref:InlB B-repeat-containing protein n=1 Tax=Lamprobacter modestohalophilus TaxID=1064514 RepID=UPI002ADECC0F|nr:hypothetical protein [Lamprobacter modestohalophilus]MEA1051078.1 hypothetical protein [Lamprobacter modestohalophilus]
MPTYAIRAIANPSNGGRVNCDPNPVTEGDASVCRAVVNSGYTFSNWSDACASTATDCTLSNVRAAKTVTANFGQCFVAERRFVVPFNSGSQVYLSQARIILEGSADIASGAELIVKAPSTRMEMGFSVASGGSLIVTADSVTCTNTRTSPSIAKSKSPGDSTCDACNVPLTLSGSRVVASAAELHESIQLQLEVLGIELDDLDGVVLDPDQRWLVLETPRALVDRDQNANSDIYYLDLLAERLSLVSQNQHGFAGNGPSRYPAVDASGELIVFQSQADNLVAVDTNRADDIFLHDLALGQTMRLTRGERNSAHPTLDAEGMTVFYDQRDGIGARRVFGQPLLEGAAAEQFSLERSPTGALLDCHHPAISADGRYLSYLEQTLDAVGAVERACWVHVYDRENGVYHRQVCPAALTESGDEVRSAFSADANTLFWSLPDRPEPIRLDNPLMAPLP